MLRLHLKNPKKIEIHLSFTLNQPKHPWDMLAEKAKAKQLEQNHGVSTKYYGKNVFSFKEESSNQSNQIAMPHQEISSEQSMLVNEQMFDEPEVLVEGVFLCPSCTCWFTNKKDLKFHKKHWCGR